jgi:aspartate aminotransferase
MKLSSRIGLVKPSATLAITAKAKALKAAGEKVLSLAAGEPDFPTPPNIRKAAYQALEDGHTGYAPSAGIPALREAVRKHYKKELDLDYGDDQVVVSCGAKHCLYNAFAALMDEGSEAIIQAPYWVSYPAQVLLSGGKPVIIDPPKSGFGLNLESIEKAINSQTRVIVLNSPSNPTGHVIENSQLDAVADLAMAHDLVVISDDIYDKLIYDDQKFVSIVQRKPQIKENCLLVNGVSKSYSMTGWRIGYAVGPSALIAAMRKIQDQSTSNATTFAQYGAVEALNSPVEIIEQMVSAFDRRRHKIVDQLSQIPGVTCRKPQGSFYAFADFSKILEMEYEGQVVGSTLSLAEILLEKERVAVIPGDAFGAPGFLRLSFAAADEDIEEAVRRIRSLIESMK